MTWTENLALGIPQIDKQHKQLCDTVDKLYDACAHGKGTGEAMAVLDFLAGYTVRHFADEEALQRKINYPHYREHKALHDAFVKQVMDLKKDAETSGVTIPMVININHIISVWLINHITKVDMELKKYVK